MPPRKVKPKKSNGAKSKDTKGAAGDSEGGFLARLLGRGKKKEPKKSTAFRPRHTGDKIPPP
jgi:hypothetical protein